MRIPATPVKVLVGGLSIKAPALVMPHRDRYEFDMIDEELTPPHLESSTTAAKRGQGEGRGTIFSTGFAVKYAYSMDVIPGLSISDLSETGDRSSKVG